MTRGMKRLKGVRRKARRSVEPVPCEELVRRFGRVARLSSNSRRLLCRWLRLKVLDNVKASITPTGTVMLSEWSSDIDSFINELVDVGIAYKDEFGNIVIPEFMRWADLFDLDVVCEDMSDDMIEIDERFKPSPLVLEVPDSAEELDEDYGDYNSSYAHIIERLGWYIDGRVLRVFTNVISFGTVNPLIFKSKIDVLAVLESKSVVAHKIIDPSRTVHRGISAMEDYLMDGVDYAVLIHVYVDLKIHFETLYKLLNRPYAKDAGLMVLSRDFNRLIILKWPRFNTLVYKSRIIEGKRRMLHKLVEMMFFSR